MADTGHWPHNCIAFRRVDPAWSTAIAVQTDFLVRLIVVVVMCSRGPSRVAARALPVSRPDAGGHAAAGDIHSASMDMPPWPSATTGSLGDGTGWPACLDPEKGRDKLGTHTDGVDRSVHHVWSWGIRYTGVNVHG